MYLFPNTCASFFNAVVVSRSTSIFDPHLPWWVIVPFAHLLVGLFQIFSSLNRLQCLFPQITAVVLGQFTLAYLIRNSPWWFIVPFAYFIGAWFNHNLFLAIHELSHNLAFQTPLYNKLLGLFANLPIGVPMSITFQKYHLEHHRYQGTEGVDMDIPTYAEGHYVTNTLSKLIWVVLQLFFYAFRPVFVNPKPVGVWELTNLALNLVCDAAIVYCWGFKPIAYLLLASFLGGGLHPAAGHFIAEHYVFLKGQETYSYYGPLNALLWHVGFHNEHHDFPRIPGKRLHKVKAIAPEFYDNLHYHTSWSRVIYNYITDPTVGPFSRVMRKRKPSVRAGEGSGTGKIH